jgi:hypothetical protein
MLSFSPRAEVVNGLFAVKKVDKVSGTVKQRLIIDGRRANALFVDPAHVRLPSPTSIARLVLARVARLFVAKTDLDSFFYRIHMPKQWWQFFALPPVAPAELGINFPPEIMILPRVYPLLTVLPMGFSHAVLLAQALHECVLSSSSLSRFPWLSGSESVVLSSVVVLIYIDDVIIIGFSRRLVSSLQSLWEILSLYRARHIVYKDEKLVGPCTLTDVLGLCFDGNALTDGLALKNKLDLSAALRQLACAPVASPGEVASLVGRFVWAALVSRRALSFAWSVYSFVRAGPLTTPMKLWPSESTVSDVHGYHFVVAC